MLRLDSPRWHELHQAYGTAEDVPRLITALAAMPHEDARAEVWFALWRMLWRPERVFDAAYAAVPHLLDLAATEELGERVQAIHLVVRVELLRRGPTAPPVPADLLEPYAAAVEALPDAVHGCTGAPWTPEVAQIMAAALLVGKRQAELAGAVLGLGEPDQGSGVDGATHPVASRPIADR
ncbi:MAG: hypothetical protein JWL60_158 [Gemmatimonadetes bacterium]|jgi:hypothetical protein|nr:hypothetical protein [Gemmatimonadota bacterium]